MAPQSLSSSSSRTNRSGARPRASARPQRSHQRGRPGSALSVSKGAFWHPFKPSADPPPAQDIRPRRLVLQDPINVTSGLMTALTCQFLFADKFGTSGYSCLALHSITVWNAGVADRSDLYVTPAAPGSFPSTIVKFEAVGSLVSRAAVGFHVSGPMVGPFAKSNNLIHVQSSMATVCVRVDATFY